jgi:hypothetical protein
MAERVFTRSEAKFEAVPGTPVVPVRRLYGVLDPNDDQPLVIREEQRGQYSDVLGAGSAFLGVETAGSTYEEDASFEDLPWFAMLGIDGTPTVTNPFGGEALAFEHALTPSETVDDLKTATFRYGTHAGAGWEAPFTLCDEFGLSFTQGGSWRLKLGLFHQKMVPAVLENLAVTTNRETLRANKTKVYFGVGGAEPAEDVGHQYAATIYEASVTVHNGRARKFFLEDDVYQATGRGDRMLEASFTFEENANSIAERANWKAKTERTIKFVNTGSIINGAVAKSAKLVLPGLWQGWELGYRETNRIFTMRLKGIYNAALAYQFAFRVVNALAGASYV